MPSCWDTWPCRGAVVSHNYEYGIAWVTSLRSRLLGYWESNSIILLDIYFLVGPYFAPEHTSCILIVCLSCRIIRRLGLLAAILSWIFAKRGPRLVWCPFWSSVLAISIHTLTEISKGQPSFLRRFSWSSLSSLSVVAPCHLLRIDDVSVSLKHRWWCSS